ncbi:MAG: sulfatase-like hydrolase/transferase [Myxococcota bacterium]
MTGGPPGVLDGLACLAFVGVSGALWRVPGRWASPLARTLPAVAIGLGILVPVLLELGQSQKTTLPFLLLALLGVLVSAVREVGPGPRPMMGALAAVVGFAFADLSLAHHQTPEAPLIAGVSAVFVACIALGRHAAWLAPLAFVPSLSREAWTAEGPVPEGPDIVLVSIDTLRMDAARTMRSFSVGGGALIEAQAAAPWTLPSMATLLTGVDPRRHGAGRSHRTFAPIRSDVTTLAERLSAAGWDTAGTAENPFVGPAFGLDRGFARFRHFDAWPWAMPVTPNTRDARPVAATVLSLVGVLPGPAHGVDRRLQDARELLADRRDRPLFLWVHILDPHLPYTHVWSAEGLTWSEKASLPSRAPEAGPSPSDEVLGALKVAYDHEVAVVDAALTDFLTELDDRPRVVVLTSDHGEAFGEHGTFEHGMSMYQELLGVPLQISGVDVGSATAGHSDLVPTLLGIAGLPAAGLDGVDLRGGRRASYPSVNPLYGEASMRAVRVPGEVPDKLVVQGTAAEAFDLARDPGELEPLPVTGALQDALPDPLVIEADGALDAGTTQALRELGYIE